MQIEMFTPARPAATPTPQREAGSVAGQACQAKAERVSDFDSKGAAEFIWSWLVRHGPASGEALVKAAKEHGYRGHDDRCFGAVFAGLARKGLITCLRSDLPRERGHGTSGGRLWGLPL